jgi:enamine deaminase RidA (YjgF/YER057c/UK114 family)
MPTVLQRSLERLGLELPPVPKPVASYIPARKVGNLIYVSGQLPMRDGKLTVMGPVPSQVSIEDAAAGARQCVLNGIAAAMSVGEIRGVVRVGAFVQSDDGFDGQPKVANGASDLLLELFGDSGRHARAAVGTNALPLNASVEVEFIFHE